MFNQESELWRSLSRGFIPQEQFSFGEAVGVAEMGRDRQFLRCARDGEQPQAGLVREAVGLALVHVLR